MPVIKLITVAGSTTPANNTVKSAGRPTNNLADSKKDVPLIRVPTGSIV